MSSTPKLKRRGAKLRDVIANDPDARRRIGLAYAELLAAVLGVIGLMGLLGVWFIARRARRIREGLSVPRKVQWPEPPAPPPPDPTLPD
jgi:hypothetical protein